jgi:hypothetical protein
MAEPLLRPDEEAIRSDRVMRFQQGASRLWRTSRMVLTSERIIFASPGLPLWYAIYSWLLLPFRFPLGPPAGPTVEIDLKDIESVWPGRDEFSRPPGVQAGDALWNFWLVEDRFPWLTRAPFASAREHYDALVGEWSAARHPGESPG